MRVLVFDVDAVDGAKIIGALQRSGHEVATCQHEADDDFVCAGISLGDLCPLDRGPVDVAVAVCLDEDAGRQPPGARCALRHSVPLVAVGPSSDGLARWATRTTSSVDPVTIEAIAEEALEAPLDRHSGAALGALREVLVQHGIDGGGASAKTTRDGNALRVGLRAGTPSIDARVREIASVRALAAVRSVDPSAVRIGVCFDE